MDTFLRLLTKPDNLPIALMAPLFAAVLAYWWHAARTNDRLLSAGGETAIRRRMQGAAPPDALPAETSRVHTWPYLLRVEVLASLASMLLLTVWSIVIDAPLEQLADPNRTPNPSKAPWYFLGLQEMLVYFDPWIAGVVLPLLIIGGLAIIPYVDVNPLGKGYYCWRPRRFAIATFLFGFVGLWLLLIFVGTFFRGPGWGWFWPWEPWDALRVPDVNTVNWPALFGVHGQSASTALGGGTVAVYYGAAGLAWLRLRRRPALKALGPVRFAIVSFLFLTMLALPIKVILRLGWDVKYIWTTPWFSI